MCPDDQGPADPRAFVGLGADNPPASGNSPAPASPTNVEASTEAPVYRLLRANPQGRFQTDPHEVNGQLLSVPLAIVELECLAPGGFRQLTDFWFAHVGPYNITNSFDGGAREGSVVIRMLNPSRALDPESWEPVEFLMPVWANRGEEHQKTAKDIGQGPTLIRVEFNKDAVRALLAGEPRPSIPPKQPTPVEQPSSPFGPFGPTKAPETQGGGAGVGGGVAILGDNVFVPDVPPDDATLDDVLVWASDVSAVLKTVVESLKKLKVE